MAQIPQPVIDAIEAIPDHEPLNTDQAAIFTGWTRRTLERRRADDLPPHPVDRAKGEDCKYMKEALRPWRKPQASRRPMHAYEVRDGAIVAHCEWDAPNAVFGTIEDLLELDWDNTSLMRQALVTLQAEQKEALAAFRAEQEATMANAFQRVTELERKQLTRAVGTAGKPSEPGVV